MAGLGIAACTDHEEELSQEGGGLPISLHQLPERGEGIEKISLRKEFDEDVVLFELNRKDDLVTDMCPPISDSLSRKYNKKFKVYFPGPFRMCDHHPLLCVRL